MEILVERGVSKGDCLEKIKNKYGAWFTVLREKKYKPPGVLGLFSKEKVEVEFFIPAQRGIAGLSNNYKKNQDTDDNTTLNFEEEKKRVLKAAGKNPNEVLKKIKDEKDKEVSQQKILEKLSEIQEKIGGGSKEKPDHPSLIRINQMLRQNDFSDKYIANILDRARRELPLEIIEDFKSVQNHILKWIGESIQIFDTKSREKKGRIIILIGPTGVGKTTTIAKLAAVYGVIESANRSSLTVQMITIDAFRIGAQEQLEMIGNVMEIPVSAVDNSSDLAMEISLHREGTDLILVDTIGRSPKDSIKLGEMKEILDACGSKAEIHLVLSSSTKTSDISHILQQFEPFGYQAVLLTKFDETRHIGNIISALSERNKPVSYITDGQIVPKDISKATVVRFLINLDDFRIDRDEIETLFPAAETANFQWSMKEN